MGHEYALQNIVPIIKQTNSLYLISCKVNLC